MKFLIPQVSLSKIVNLGQSVADKRNTMPILYNFKLEVFDGLLKIIASDLEVTLVQQINVSEAQNGAIAVNAKTFTEGINELPEGLVSIQVIDRNRLLVECESTSLKFVGYSANEYPTPPGIDLFTSSLIDGKRFEQMLRKTIFAASVDETRFNLNAVCMVSLKDENSLKMVATDGYRLAVAIQNIEDLQILEQILVPRKGIIELRKLLGDEINKKDIKIGVTKEFLILETPDAKLAIRLIDSEFPEYQQAIPQGQCELVVVDATLFSNALRRVSLVITDKGKGAKFHFEGNTLLLSASSAELGDAEDEVPINYSGAPLTIGFNARYLSDLVQAYGETGPLHIELRGPFAATKFFSPDDQNAFGIVMPMRID
jgi:DNA polymerase-3 subunit beta